VDQLNNGKMYIRRTRGDYWGALAMTAIRNASPFASIPHVLWGDREDRGARELVIFIWVNAPFTTTATETFCDAQLNIIDAALEKIPSFKTSGEFPNK
jgi:hypothetical protein